MRLPRVAGADEGGEAHGEVGLEALGDGEEAGVAPDAGGASADGLAGELAAGGIKVVGDFQGGEAVWTSREWAIAVAFATLVAFQFVRGTGILHWLSLRGKGQVLDVLSFGGDEETGCSSACGTACSESHVPRFP